MVSGNMCRTAFLHPLTKQAPSVKTSHCLRVSYHACVPVHMLTFCQPAVVTTMIAEHNSRRALFVSAVVFQYVNMHCMLHIPRKTSLLQHNLLQSSRFLQQAGKNSVYGQAHMHERVQGCCLSGACIILFPPVQLTAKVWKWKKFNLPVTPLGLQVRQVEWQSMPYIISVEC